MYFLILIYGFRLSGIALINSAHEYNYLTFLPFENVNVESLQFIWSSIEDMHDIVALGALLHFISWFHSYSFHFQRPLSECWSPNLLHWFQMASNGIVLQRYGLGVRWYGTDEHVKTPGYFKRMLFIIIIPKLHIALCTRLWQQKGTGKSQSHFKW